MSCVTYRLWGAGILLTALLACGCSGKRFVIPDSTHQNVRSASRSIATEIAQKLQPFLPSWQSRSLMVGKIINESTAEITVSGDELQWMLLLDLRNELPGVRITELSASDSVKDAIVIQGITKYLPGKLLKDQQTDAAGNSRGLKISSKEGSKEPDSSSSWFQINLAATDASVGATIGEARFLVNARQFDPSPSRFFRDAPMYLTGIHHKERLAALAGKEKPQLAALQADAALADAMADYNRDDYGSSQQKFFGIVKKDHQNLTALSGNYQSLIKLGKVAEAEQAFGTLLQSAIAENSLSVRLLFRVRSKELRDDGDLAIQYPIWIRQLARNVLASGKCLEINGHASKSGSAEYNNELSLRRAQWIMEQMILVEPKLATRLHAYGKGFRENIIGSGSDNALDAIDRRVDFVFKSCRR